LIRGVEKRQYWNLFDLDTGSTTTTLAGATDRLRTLLERSVEKRLMADVPVGVFLSGRLDSSAVVGISSELKDDPLETYSVAFENEMLDESEEARLVVDHFGTDHHEVDIGLSSMDLLTEHGITPDREIVLYCNTARRISHTYVVLKSLGYENVAFYGESNGVARQRRRGRERASFDGRRQLIRTAVSQFRCDRRPSRGRTGTSLQQTV